MRSLTLSTVAFLLLSSAGMLACAGSTEDDGASGAADLTTASGTPTLIDASKDKKTVDVPAGQSFTITLPSNASTGYRWSVTGVDRSLGEPKQTDAPGDVTRPGSSGTQSFTWATTSPIDDLTGKHTITLGYNRPWSETSPPEKTFEVTVNIVKPAATAIAIGEASNKKTVDVKAGQPFTVTLPSNASTGYSWSVTTVDRSLGQPKQSTEPGDVTRPGSSGTQSFTWATTSPIGDLTGKHKIQLGYSRPFAETTPPEKTFEVTVNIVK